MAAPKAIKLISTKTGEEQIFGSISQACDFLCRSKTYITWRMFGEEEALTVTSESGEEYIFEVLGMGKRKDAVEPVIRRKNGALNQWQYPQQICWGCARASGFCDWSRKLKPIEGWEARAVRSSYDGQKNYLISKCPLFVPDAKTPEERREQRKALYKELEEVLEREGDAGRIKSKPSASPACKRAGVEYFKGTLAETAVGASDEPGDELGGHRSAYQEDELC